MEILQIHLSLGRAHVVPLVRDSTIYELTSEWSQFALYFSLTRSRVRALFSFYTRKFSILFHFVTVYRLLFACSLSLSHSLESSTVNLDRMKFHRKRSSI